MLQLSPSMPDITTRQPVSVFKIGEFMAFLIVSPKAIAERQNPAFRPIEYIFVLWVANKENELKLLVTSEVTGDVVVDIAKQHFKGEFSRDPHLCVFDQTGNHINFGQSIDWANQEKFAGKALKTTCEFLKIDAIPVELHAKPEASGCLTLFVLIGLLTGFR